MSTLKTTTRTLRGVAATVVVLLVGLLIVPRVSTWQKHRLVVKLTARVTMAEDHSVKIPLRQLASLGELSLEPLVLAASSQRAAVASVARQILNEKMATWQQAAETTRARIGEHEYVRLSTRLAMALGLHIEKFGPGGKQWAEHLALSLIQMSDRMPARQTQTLLENCSHILAVVPPRGPRLQTFQHGLANLVPYTPDRLPAALPPLESLAHSSEIALENMARLRPSPPLNFRSSPGRSRPSHSSPSKLMPALTPSVQHDTTVIAPTTNGSTLRWSNRGPTKDPTQGSSIKSETVPIAPPASTPITGLVKVPRPRFPEKTLRPISSPSSTPGQVVAIPTPKAMANQAKSLRLKSVDELLLRHDSAQHFEAGALRSELARRGYTQLELAAHRVLASPDTQTRLYLVEDATRLPAASARRVLRWLLEDSNPTVRLRALTALATTNAPELYKIASDLAARDEDPEVAKLATRLLKQR